MRAGFIPQQVLLLVVAAVVLVVAVKALVHGVFFLLVLRIHPLVASPSPSFSSESDDGPWCQLCERYGHTVHDCWYRFNKKFVPPHDGGSWPIKPAPQKLASSVVPSCGIDTN